MTKRTNAFQKTILHIHEQLKDIEVKVIESAMVLEQNVNSKIEREIDILIEKEENGVITRIAIECRDRKNKDDIIWIDGLIGKFMNLNINKVIAVSSSGFSKSAISKARAHNIELRTINEVNEIDWNKEFIKIEMCDLQLEFKINKTIVETETGKLIHLNKDCKVIVSGQTGFFSEFFEAFKVGFWKKVFKEEFNKSFLKVYKKKDDLSKYVKLKHRVPINDMKIVIGEVNYNVKALILYLIGKPQTRDLMTQQLRYQDSIISKTVLNIDDDKSLTFFTSQAKSKSPLNISVDRKKK